MQLTQYDSGRVGSVDLVVAGAGPSGLAVAKKVAGAGFEVVVVDPLPLSAWPNNYGVWVDEFEAMGLQDYYDTVWPKANVHLGEDCEKFLNRPYARVDRHKLKERFLSDCVAAGVTFLKARAASVEHHGGSSTLTCSDGTDIQTAMTVDATGHVCALVRFDKVFEPGYQGAYGIMAHVESHPFDLDTMLFMDWRDGHTAGRPDMAARNSRTPTFLYAMPFSDTKVFLEETSLVARPAVPFPELRDRMWARLEHLGITVRAVEEEEFCLIPMGGVLPQQPQRVLGIGGTAGMVHPSTGYMVARTLGVAPTLADAIVEELCKPTDAANASPEATTSSQDAEDSSTAIWRAIWPPPRVRQREFFNYGMEIVLKLDLQQTRDFFTAFFSLSDYYWQGFLSARLGFSQLILFGLQLFLEASNKCRINILRVSIAGLPGLIVRLVKTLD